MNLNSDGMLTARLIRPGLLLLMAATFSGCGPSGNGAHDAFADAIRAMESRVDGSIGVYALETGTGSELAYRADDRFAVASTFKVLLVAAILADVDRGRLALSDAVEIEGRQIQEYSPVVGELDEGQSISLARLCEAAITVSDNTAANMLLELVGGPAGLTRFLRNHGDQVTRLDRFEGELNENLRDDERDTSTPRAMANSVARALFSDLLGDDSKKRLRDWLVASKTGSARLRAGLPARWRVGDKTGTGMNGAVNDVAVAWPPGRQPIVIAVYMSWSERDVAALGAIHAEIAALVAETIR